LHPQEQKAAGLPHMPSNSPERQMSEKEGGHRPVPTAPVTILIVEDEPAMQKLLTELLTQAGYQVLVARHGIHALQLCKHHPDPIHLLLTDISMPYMDGRELATHARTVRPEMRVLYMSGGDQRPLVGGADQDAALDFVQKPFGPDDLLHKVRACLR